MWSPPSPPPYCTQGSFETEKQAKTVVRVETERILEDLANKVVKRDAPGRVGRPEPVGPVPPVADPIESVLVQSL